MTTETTSTIGSGKTINGQSREIVYNVFNYFLNNIKRDGQIVNICELYNLTSLATGVSNRSIQRIICDVRSQVNPPLNQGKAPESLQSPGPVFKTPGTKRPRLARKSNLDEFNLVFLRQCIYDFHLARNTLPTINKLLELLQESINYRGSATTLRQIVHKLGFRSRKAKKKKTLLIEKSEIRSKRISYLSQLQVYRAQGRPIVYSDETYIHNEHMKLSEKSLKDPKALDLKGDRLTIIHACTEKGFVSNTLLVFKSTQKSNEFYVKMNASNYIKWVKQRLLPNLQPQSVVVIDNASHHNELIESSTNLKNKKIFLVDKILEEHGHSVLRLPAYHPDLNLIELLWNKLKEKVAYCLQYVEFNVVTVQSLFQEEVDAITVDVFKEVFTKLRESEQAYMDLDPKLDEYTKRLLIKDTEDGKTASCEISSSDDDDDVNREDEIIHFD